MALNPTTANGLGVNAIYLGIRNLFFLTFFDGRSMEVFFAVGKP
jgi:hypothetical protein